MALNHIVFRKDKPKPLKVSTVCVEIINTF